MVKYLSILLKYIPDKITQVFYLSLRISHGPPQKLTPLMRQKRRKQLHSVVVKTAANTTLKLQFGE